MITAQVESFERRVDELNLLFPLHWEELALNKDKVPLAPRYDVYFDRERAGELMMVTLRCDGVMIGYFVGFVAPGLHYQTCLTCTMDMFFVHPAHRGKHCGVRLFRAVKAELKRRGVQRWLVGSKCHADASRLFVSLGFDKIETYFSMWLGD